jgi:hypothetical protein
MADHMLEVPTFCDKSLFREIRREAEPDVKKYAQRCVRENDNLRAIFINNEKLFINPIWSSG